MNTGFLGPTVATVPTVYGIETLKKLVVKLQMPLLKLQQYLPFTVLKLTPAARIASNSALLQQYLPFTVLKLNGKSYWNSGINPCCNSTYRLRY